ncbi:MAG: hypothetical protein PVJ57_00075 [Phycisphaerae bacterium]|jgi:hypothetical protein
MSKTASLRFVLTLEAVGFGLAILLLWADELLDLPHRLLGAPATPVNWQESLLESVMVAVLAAATMCWTYRTLRRLRYLEGFQLICCFCKRVRVGEEWRQLEAYISDHTDAEFSHGLCPECLRVHYLEAEE